MKKLVRRGMALSMAAVMTAGSVTTAFAFKDGEWKRDQIGWWWQNEDGSCLKSTGEWLDGDKDGVAELYYFDENGYLLTNTSVEGILDVNADGQWIENGIVKTQGKKYTDALAKVTSSTLNIYKNPDKESVAMDPDEKEVTAYCMKNLDLVSYRRNVDKLENTNVAKPIGTGITFPDTKLTIGEDLYWQNTSGGTDYQLYYCGDMGDPEAEGYQRESFINPNRYWTFDSWTTPSGIVVDYNRRVLDENGKIMTATAKELGLDYEGGKVRDVAYDSNYPLKRVVDLYALNVEKVDHMNIANDYGQTGLYEHIALITRTEEEYIICKLSGQENQFDKLSQTNGIVYYTDEEKARYDAEVEVLRDWLNSFDFEHASEMERALKVCELMNEAETDYETLADLSLASQHFLYEILINKKGRCEDDAYTRQFLSALVGLKCDMIGSPQVDHVECVVQVDGAPYPFDSRHLKDEVDWREYTRLGTRHSINYWCGETILY